MVHIIPWSIRKGMTNLTERGQYDGNLSHITFLQKILTGKEAIVVCWSGSTDLIKPKRATDTKDKTDPVYWTNNYYKYDFHKGYYFLGTPISGSCNREVDFDNSQINEDMISMKSNANWKIRFDFQPSDLIKDNSTIKKVNYNAKLFKLNNQILKHKDLIKLLEEQGELSHKFLPKRSDFYKFYSIPELNENEWLYISNCDYEFREMSGKICACEITFSSVSDLIQTSGRAQEQYIQCGAIGEPYTFPKIKINEESGKSYLDFEIVEPKRARWLQVDWQGPGGFTDVIVMGREIYKDEEGNWCTKAPKQLLFNRLAEPKINEFNRNSLPTKNYYLFHDSMLLFETSKEWIETWKNIDNVVSQNAYSSAITLGNKSEWQDFIHKSNPIDGTPPTHISYLDADWHPLNNLGLMNKTFDNIGSPYCADSITYWSTDNMVQILNKNSFVFSTQEIIPLSFYSTNPYKLSNFPIIGGFLAKMLGDRTLNPRLKRLYTFRLMMFLGCDVGSLMKSIPNAELSERDDIRTFLGLFNGKEDAPKSLGMNATMTSILGELTDKVKIVYDDKYEIVDTELLGQKRYPNGEFIRENEEKLVFADAEGQPAIPYITQNNFVVDLVITQSIFNGNIRITAYSGVNVEESLWAETICSNTKWRQDSYVDWTSIIYTGGWDDIWTIREDEMTWPETPEMEISAPFIPVDVSMAEATQGFVGDDRNYLQNMFFVWEHNSHSGKYEYVDTINKTFYNQRTKDIYMNYHDFDGTITTKQEFLTKYAGKTLQVQIEGKVNEHHHDIFYDADFGTQTPDYYEIHLDQNGAVIEQEIAVFGKNMNECLTNFVPYETDIYANVWAYWERGTDWLRSRYGLQKVKYTVQITFELLDNEMIVHFIMKDMFYYGDMDISQPEENYRVIASMHSGPGVGRNSKINSFYLKIKNIIFPEE